MILVGKGGVGGAREGWASWEYCKCGSIMGGTVSKGQGIL